MGQSGKQDLQKVNVSMNLNTGTASDTLANYGIFWNAPFPALVTGATYRYSTASGTAATLTLYKVPSGTAKASGKILGTSGSLAATADILRSFTLSGTASIPLVTGDSLYVVPSEAPGSLIGLSVTVALQRV